MLSVCTVVLLQSLKHATDTMTEQIAKFRGDDAKTSPKVSLLNMHDLKLS